MYKEGIIVIKGLILQEYVTVLNLYGPKNKASNYVKRTLLDLKREIDKLTIKVGDFSTLLSKMDRSSQQKISKDITKFNYTNNKADIIAFNRLYYQWQQNACSFRLT